MDGRDSADDDRLLRPQTDKPNALSLPQISPPEALRPSRFVSFTQNGETKSLRAEKRSI
jgi:hypothetical protein